jgi:DNA-binding transcriptional MerR regulator/effector-binding domain-containing protein
MKILLTIGEFSRMTHLSVKALRHYHDVGLLEPADVDTSSGYRLYAATQVPTAQLIRRFRDLEMPLEDVRSVLSAPDTAARNAAIAAHLERMEDRLEQTRATVASLRALLQESLSHSAIEYRTDGSTTALAIREAVRFADCDTWLAAAYGELYEAAADARLDLAGPAGALYAQEFFEAEIGEVVAFVPVSGGYERVTTPRTRMIEVPAAELAVMTHYGAFADIDRTYGALGTIVAELSIGIDGPIREHYLITDADTDDISQQRTEVCWPISRQPHPRKLGAAS